MAKTVQIRNVPEKMHEVWKSEASAAGVSLSEYLLGLLSTVTPDTRVTPESVWEQIKKRPPLNLGMSAADLIQEGREERDRELDEAITGRR